jgi:hypothetical protein
MAARRAELTPRKVAHEDNCSGSEGVGEEEAVERRKRVVKDTRMLKGCVREERRGWGKENTQMGNGSPRKRYRELPLLGLYGCLEVCWGSRVVCVYGELDVFEVWGVVYYV